MAKVVERSVPAKTRKIIKPILGSRSVVTGEEYIDPNEAYWQKLDLLRAQEERERAEKENS
jgi:hypothetical protein